MHGAVSMLVKSPSDSQEEQHSCVSCRKAQQAWLLQTAAEVWSSFEAGFRALWLSPARKGDAHPAALYPVPDERHRRDAQANGVSGDLNGSVGEPEAGHAVRGLCDHTVPAS